MCRNAPLAAIPTVAHCLSMRCNIVVAISVLLTACGEQSPPAIDGLEIYAPSLSVEITNQGSGKFSKNLAPYKSRSGSFSFTPQQFRKLIRRLEVFRRSGDAVTLDEFKRVYMLAPRCVNYVTDNGGITFHWIGPNINEYYRVDYGCNPDQNAERNKEFRAILRSLAVPEPAPLP